MYKAFLHNNFLRLILIESQWNLNNDFSFLSGILLNINRITVEFKYNQTKLRIKFFKILIESQWNLNMFHTIFACNQTRILIESQWNLNSHSLKFMQRGRAILIESQWNLNRRYAVAGLGGWGNINRITVEFKFASRSESGERLLYINRITVEFKS